MLLYDIFYDDGTMDRDRPLPDKSEEGAVAVCVNWDNHRYVFRDGDWTPDN